MDPQAPTFIAAVQIAGIVLTLIGGVGSVWLIDWITTQVKLNVRMTQVVTAAVAILIAVSTALVTGLLTPESVTVINISALFATVFAASQAEYQRLKRAREKE